MLPDIIRIIIQYTSLFALPNLFATHKIPFSLQFKCNASHSFIHHTHLNYILDLFPAITITGITCPDHESLPKIKKQLIQHLKIDTYDLTNLFLLSNYKNLKSLTVYRTHSLSISDILYCPNLRTIHLSCSRFDELNISLLSQCKHLKHLTLISYKISHLPKLKLKSFTLDSCDIHDFSHIKAKLIKLMNYDITPINAATIHTKHLILSFHKGYNEKLLSIPSHIIIQTMIHPPYFPDVTKNLDAGITYLVKQGTFSYCHKNAEYAIYDTKLKCSPSTTCPIVHSLIPYDPNKKTQITYIKSCIHQRFNPFDNFPQSKNT